MVKKVLVIAATNRELNCLKGINLNNTRLQYLVTGIGVSRTIDKLESIILNKFDMIINAGICGSLFANLKKGDLIIPNQVNIEEEACNAIEIKNKMLEDMQLSCPYYQEAIVTVKSPVNNIERKSEIIESFKDAVAVDMELYPIARKTLDYNIPLIALKVVSDLCEDFKFAEILEQTKLLMNPIKNILTEVIKNK
ncbi:MAG: hypothetical protein K9M80_03570 [Candidatus Marinimicrobia bacterium]|nr:hypothetical protein [Candidatus Neomarinimicrobiota bacterium]